MSPLKCSLPLTTCARFTYRANTSVRPIGTLVSLLRQFEYHELADEVGRRGYYTVSPPPRSDAKYYCALQAAHLMVDFTGRKLTKRGRFQEITSLLYGAVTGGKVETCESACERVIEWLKEPITEREFFSQYEDIEREMERMVSSALSESASSDDVAIQSLDLSDHFLKKATQAAELHAAAKRQIEKAIRATDAKWDGFEDCVQSLGKAVELLSAGKRQHIEEFRKAGDRFVAWKKQYPKEAIGDDLQRCFWEALDLWTACIEKAHKAQNTRLLDDCEDCRYIEEAREAPKKPRDTRPPIPPKGER
jgi:hypothetical protein